MDSSSEDVTRDVEDIEDEEPPESSELTSNQPQVRTNTDLLEPTLTLTTALVTRNVFCRFFNVVRQTSLNNR